MDELSRNQSYSNSGFQQSGGPSGGENPGGRTAADNRRVMTLEGNPAKSAKYGGGSGGASGPGRRRGGGLKVFLIILALCLALVAVSIVACDGENDYFTGPYIGTLYVEGTIQSSNSDSFGRATGYQHGWTLEQINRMMYDSNNKGLIFYVDSPGGGVYESDELYLKIREYQQVSGNPVYVYMGSMAASGGYYIAAPADKIYANRNTWTGSIGVTLGSIYDISGFLERFGIRTETITSGRNKSMGSSTEPMTEEQKAIWQSLVDEAYDQFVGIVAEGRGMDTARVYEIADGRIYSAKQALDLELIDAIGTFSQAVGDMQKTYGLWDCEVVDLTYESGSIWGSLLGAVSQLRAGNSEAEILLSLIRNESQMPVSYLCTWLQ